jgi:hypothetical protein
MRMNTAKILSFVVISIFTLCFSRLAESGTTVPTEAAGGALPALCSMTYSGGVMGTCMIMPVAGKQIHVANVTVTGSPGSYAGGCANVILSNLASGTQSYRWCLQGIGDQNQLIVPFPVPTPSMVGGNILLTVGAIGNASSVISVSVSGSTY